MVSFFLGALIAIYPALAVIPLARAADGTVSLSLSRPVALELQAQLAPVRATDLLESLGIQDIATMNLAIPVPMRDGVELAATVIVPRNQSVSPSPVILIRSPYKLADELGEPLAAKLVPELVRNGYVIVIVNDRGSQWSQGHYHWLQGANRDGYDILQWIVKQPWSDGKVGAFGCSSSAESQPGMATLNHPALKAIVEMAGATALGNVSGYHDQGAFYTGGIPNLAWAWWYRSFGHVNHPQLPRGLSPIERARVAGSYSPEPSYGMSDLASLANQLPSKDILRAVGTPESEWDRLIRLSPNSPEWAAFDFIREGDGTSVPGLHIDSWYDIMEAYPTIKLFQALSLKSPNQHLVMGATAHCMMGTETEHTTVGDREVGDARFDYVPLIQGWFDEWLKGLQPRVQVPAVQYYVLNSNHWESAPTWPPPGGKLIKLFLESNGDANSQSGGGKLVEHTLSKSAASDRFIYDPVYPVSSLGGGCCSDAVSREQSSIESRQDVLVYTTPVYSKTVRIVGDVDVELSVSTSVRDTDLMAKLVDVYTDGHAYNLTDTALRLRYRDGTTHPTLMTPGHIYQIHLHGMITATDMLPGHRLRMEITGSSFPSYERNLNTGGTNFDERTRLTATTQIFHDATHRSFVEYSALPIPKSQ